MHTLRNVTSWLLATLAGLMLTVGVARAQPIGLALGIDGSGSISAADFALQRDAYASVLSSLPANGSIAVGVWQFSTNVQQEFGLQLIDSAATRTNLINAINGMTQLGNLTNLAGAISTGATALTGFGPLSKAIIDISTDGVATTGADPLTAANNAIAAGIDQVNCLGVGAGLCGFIAGTDSFSVTATSFADFQDALTRKIAQEVPEPSTVLLMGVGLAGVGFSRRRMSARSAT